MKSTDFTSFAFGPYLLDPGEHRLTRDGQEIRLRPKTFEVLKVLVSRHGHLFEKEELLELVWPDTFITEKVLRQSIVEIREALDDHGPEHHYIETVPKIGYQFVGDVQEIASSKQEVPSNRIWKASVVLLALALVLVVLNPWSNEPPRNPVTRFSLAIPENAGFDVPPMYPLAISPNGRLLAYRASSGKNTRLLLRALDKLEAVELAGSEGADAPFFSPDGNWVGFFRGPALYKVMATGGLPVKICTVEEKDQSSEISLGPGGEASYSINSGASWGSDGKIVFSMYTHQGIWEVSADGGPARKVSGDGRWPQLLPNGEHILFSLMREGRYRTAILSLKTGERRILDVGEAGTRYVSTGHLLYGSTGTIYAVPFDSSQLRVSGSPNAVVERVAMHPYQLAYFAVSESGTLAYMPGYRRSAILVVDREGEARELVRESCGYQHPRFSPDGTRIVVTKLTEGTHFNIWVYDLQRGSRVQLTNTDINTNPIWSHDGSRVIFSVPGKGIYWCPADGSRQKELLLEQRDTSPLRPTSLSADGKTLLFHTRGKDTQRDVWVYSIGGEAAPLLNSEHDESHARFSPGGQWILFDSSDSGREEVYLKPYPLPAGRWMISIDGGTAPAWSPLGNEIFYLDLAGTRLLSSSFRGFPSVEIGSPEFLLEPLGRQFDVSPDGKSFVMVKSVTPRAINVVINWFDELKRLAP